jgi:DNA-binding transcriptional ArsR family regulator
VSDQPGHRETSQTLDRGLQLLTALAESDSGRTVTELATALGVARPVVYRLLATLEQHHLAHRAADGRVRLGLGVLALAGRVQPLLRDAATPVLRRLADDVGATAHLTVVDGSEALAVAVVEPRWTQRTPVSSDGELQPDAHGVAVAWRVGALEGSVGVVSLGPLAEDVPERVMAAAEQVVARLS